MSSNSIKKLFENQFVGFLVSICGIAGVISCGNVPTNKPSFSTVKESYSAAPRSRAQIIEYGLTGIGSSYVWGGNTWDRQDRSNLGADCSGFAIRTWAFPRDDDPEVAIERIGNTSTLYNYDQTSDWFGIDISAAQAGDILVRTGDPGHAMVVYERYADGTFSVIQAGGRGSGINQSTVDASSYIAIQRANLTEGGNMPDRWTPILDSNNRPGMNQDRPVDIQNPGYYVMEITVPWINFRVGYSQEYVIIDTLPKGARIVAVGFHNGWYNVTNKGDWGWMKGEGLTLIQSINDLSEAQPILDQGVKVNKNANIGVTGYY